MMRQDGTHKVFMNHVIDPSAHLIAQGDSGNSWVYKARGAFALPARFPSHASGYVMCDAVGQTTRRAMRPVKRSQ